MLATYLTWHLRQALWQRLEKLSVPTPEQCRVLPPRQILSGPSRRNVTAVATNGGACQADDGTSAARSRACTRFNECWRAVSAALCPSRPALSSSRTTAPTPTSYT